MKTPALYTIFANLRDDSSDSVVLAGVPATEWKHEYRAIRKKMRAHRFRVREHKCEVTNLPIMTIVNPITGNTECRYWVSETA